MPNEPCKLLLPLGTLAEISFKTTLMNVCEDMLYAAVYSPFTECFSDLRVFSVNLGY